MSAVLTKKDVQEIVKKSADDVLSVLDIFMVHVDERFNKVEQEINELKTSHDRLIRTIDNLIARIDKYETELAARDNQFQKLLIWARKVSDKTGIPLENL